jgi:hypothetical protein
MSQWLIAMTVFSLVMAGMAVGVMRGRKPIKGSCGGLNTVGMTGACEICGKDPERCEKRKAAARS